MASLHWASESWKTRTGGLSSRLGSKQKGSEAWKIKKKSRIDHQEAPAHQAGGHGGM